jgi:hypothetical protein
VKMTYQTSQMLENQRKIDQAQQMDQG